MNAPKRIAVILFQLGGPDTQAAVEPFLYNLFCDPDIINFPGAFLARKALAKLISTRRSKSVGQHYAEIGGASPIRRLTEQQARALETALRPHISARTIVAMRYWHPDTPEAIAALETLPFDELVLLPLYPQYSFATTGSSLKEWKRLYQAKVPVHLIDHFYDHPDYIAAIVDRVNRRSCAAPELGRSPSRFQRPRLADSTRREGRSLPETDRRNGAARPRTRRLAQSSRTLFPESRRSAEVAPAVADHFDPENGAQRDQAHAHHSGLFPHRAHRNAARNQY